MSDQIAGQIPLFPASSKTTEPKVAASVKPSPSVVTAIDFETTSSASLKAVGSFQYAQHPSTQVLVSAYQIGAGPVHSLTLYELVDGRLPTELDEAIKGGSTLAGWNFFGFEHPVLRAKFGYDIPPEQVSDTMHRAAYAGLPRGLGACGEALGLGESEMKDETGARIMKRMASPRGYDAEGEAIWWHETSPARLQTLAEYCAQDVVAERSIAAMIPELPEFERQIELLHAEMNITGLPIDFNLAGALESLANEAAAAANALVHELTDGVVTNVASQINQIKVWLGPLYPGSLRQEIVEKMLERTDLPADVRRVLELRLAVSKSSTKKITKTFQVADPVTRRVHGVLAYQGANRTGRTSSKVINFQNFPRPVVKDYDQSIKDILAGASVEELEAKYGLAALGLVSGSLRAMITAPEDQHLTIADSAQIEARVLPWLSDQTDVLAVFAAGEDVYTHAAKKLGSDDRNLGKVLTLACIAEGELVLTDQGLIPIEMVTTDQRVWDGNEWVEHEGVIFRGDKPIIEYEGLRATPDHKVWVEGSKSAMPFDAAASELRKLLMTGAGRSPIDANYSAISEVRPVPAKYQTGNVTRVYDLLNAGPRHRFTVSNALVSNCGYGMGPNKFQATAARAPKPIILSEVEAAEAVNGWRAANRQITSFWSNMDAAVRGAYERFIATSRTVTARVNSKLGLSVSVSRARNGQPLMTIMLPSGRRLYYRNISINDSGEIIYWGNDADRWAMNRTYGGKLVENITQAVARDVVYAQALKVRKELPEAKMILAVHDELVALVETGKAQQTLDRMIEIMSEAPAWAHGLPLGAEGKIAKFYGK
jgi:DNA polymerase